MRRRRNDRASGNNSPAWLIPCAYQRALMMNKDGDGGQRRSRVRSHASGRRCVHDRPSSCAFLVWDAHVRLEGASVRVPRARATPLSLPHHRSGVHRLGGCPPSSPPADEGGPRRGISVQYPLCGEAKRLQPAIGYGFGLLASADGAGLALCRRDLLP